MTAYYNEFDPYAAEWLRNLISAGHIAPGDVDTRSIVDVREDDIRGYTQCHFFAGIGGWSHALRLAGWPDDQPVWTGSCPCQPFSAAGKQKGTADERHLWPALARLIQEREPPVVFGEQVASKLGREWLSGVRADLEDMGYAVGAADLCAAGAGAPHIRQRVWWVADTAGERRTGERLLLRPEAGGWDSTDLPEAAGSGATGGLADAQRDTGGPGRLADQSREGAGAQVAGPSDEPGRRGMSGGLGDADDARSQGRLDRSGEGGRAGQRPAGPSGVAGFWSRYDVVHCTDGKARRFEPGSFPLAYGVSNRVGRLRAYGNAIVPQVAAEFIRAASLIEGDAQ